MNNDTNVVEIRHGVNSTTTFDVERIRADFPILDQSVYGKPLVYFDNGASAQKPRQVIDAMNDIMETQLQRPSRRTRPLTALDGGLRGGAWEGGEIFQRR